MIHSDVDCFSEEALESFDELEQNNFARVCA